MNESIFFALWIGMVAALPAAIVWGWVRWGRAKKIRTAFSMLSATAFLLATASAVLALSSMIYARAIGGFPFYDPTLMRIYRSGALLSISGIVLGIVGVWRPSPLRWHAPLCATGMLVFWALAALGE